ncbi:hypothetical protein HDV00_012165 [Rhizophlyctis rosea]|nr:hypothetical protein HDV00_012165 [Rhizophlyctis rosea]
MRADGNIYVDALPISGNKKELFTRIQQYADKNEWKLRWTSEGPYIVEEKPPQWSFPSPIPLPNLPPTLILKIARLSDPITSRLIRSANKRNRALIKPHDLVLAEIGWRLHTRGLQNCYDWAIRHWHEDIIISYASAASCQSRQYALHTAATKGLTPTVEKLLRKGAYVDHPTLSEAQSHPDMIHPILKAFTGIYHINEQAHISLEMNHLLISSAKQGLTETVLLLLRKNTQIPHFIPELALTAASEAGHIEIVMYLLLSHADVHYNNDEALINAATKGHVDIVQVLLCSAASIHAQNDLALISASKRGHVDVVEMLLERGANPHAQGGLALIAAGTSGHVRVVELLLSEGADMDSYGHATLMGAATRGHAEIVKWILRVGVVSRAEVGEALTAAAGQGHVGVVEVLLETRPGFDVRRKALFAAARAGSFDVGRTLLEWTEREDWAGRFLVGARRKDGFSPKVGMDLVPVGLVRVGSRYHYKDTVLSAEGVQGTFAKRVCMQKQQIHIPKHNLSIQRFLCTMW